MHVLRCKVLLDGALQHEVRQEHHDAHMLVCMHHAAMTITRGSHCSAILIATVNSGDDNGLLGLCDVQERTDEKQAAHERTHSPQRRTHRL